MSGAFNTFTPDRDRESVCWITTATGDEIQTGTIRHDDRLPAPGWLLFDQNQTQVNTAQPGFEFVACAGECCPEVIGEGCWRNGTNSGRWVSIRVADGTVTVTDPVTGNTVAPADVVECVGATYETRISTVTGATSFTIPGGGETLVSWSVRARTGQPTLAVGGSTTTMDEGEIIESAAQRDELSVLDEEPIVTTTVNSSARVVYLLRTAGG